VIRLRRNDTMWGMPRCVFIVGLIALGACSSNDRAGAPGTADSAAGANGGSSPAGRSAGGAAGSAGMSPQTGGTAGGAQIGGGAGTTAVGGAGRGGSAGSSGAGNGGRGGSAGSSGAGGSSGRGGNGAGEGGAAGGAGASGVAGDGYGPCSTPSDCQVPNSSCSSKYGCQPPCDNSSNVCHAPTDGSSAIAACAIGHCVLTCSLGVLTCPSDLKCNESDFCVVP